MQCDITAELFFKDNIWAAILKNIYNHLLLFCGTNTQNTLLIIVILNYYIYITLLVLEINCNFLLKIQLHSAWGPSGQAYICLIHWSPSRTLCSLCGWHVWMFGNYLLSEGACIGLPYWILPARPSVIDLVFLVIKRLGLSHLVVISSFVYGSGEWDSGVKKSTVEEIDSQEVKHHHQSLGPCLPRRRGLPNNFE